MSTSRRSPGHDQEAVMGDKGPGSKSGGKKPKQDKKKKAAATS